MNQLNPQVFPSWEHVSAEEAGFHPDRLAEAVTFAQANESSWPRNMYKDGIYIGCVDAADPEPFNRAFGPVFPRGGANGLIIRNGRLVAEWGDTRRADVTFSVAKSYLALLAGIAVDRTLIGSIDDRVGDLIRDDGFDEQPNALITWRHLLEQTSEWQGTLFGIPDSADWHRQAGPSELRQAAPTKGSFRARRQPGTHFEYNDVRVNRLSLCLLRLFGEGLPEVLRTNIMAKIGCSADWEWHGYETSTVDVNGQKISSVSGGSHWGGGLRISTRDHARVAEMVLGRGCYGNERIISEDWISQMLTPSRHNKNYGLLWWLNSDGSLYPDAPKTSVFALGGGSNLIWIDPPTGLLAVVRWINKPDVSAFIRNVTMSIRPV